MSITTYKLEVLFGGWPMEEDGNYPEEFFIKLRDALLECGNFVQHVQLDCHYEDTRISQRPDGGMFGDKSYHIQSLKEALEMDKRNDEMWQKMTEKSISEENGKSEQTRVDPNDPSVDSQPVG